MLCFLLLSPGLARAGEQWLSLSTGSPIFGYRLLNKAAQGLSVGGVTDNVNVLSGRSLRYGRRFDHRRAGRNGFVSAVSVGLFQYSLKKPEGLGVFVDPVMLRSQAAFVELETGYRHRINSGGTYLFSASGSIGAQISYARISATSKVLNIRESLLSAQPYVQVKLDRKLGRGRVLAPWLSLRLSRHNYRELSAGIDWSF